MGLRMTSDTCGDGKIMATVERINTDSGMKLYDACMPVMDKNLMIQISSWTT